MSIDAMKQALEYIKATNKSSSFWMVPASELNKTVTALRLAIEQAEREDVPSVEDNSQHWNGMDGAIAWHLIERHANGWADVGKMMDEWREANTAPPQRQPLTEAEIFDAENSVPDSAVSDRDWCVHFARAIERAHGIGGLE